MAKKHGYTNRWAIQTGALTAHGAETVRLTFYLTADSFHVPSLTTRDGTSVQRPAGFNVMPVYEIDAADTFDLAHNGMLWHKDAGGAVTYTCANDATIPQGATYVVANEDTENVTIADGSITLRWFGGTGAPSTGDRTLAQGGVATVYKYADAEFWIWGIGIS